MKTILCACAAFLLTVLPTAAAAAEIVLPLAGTIVNAGAEITVRVVLAAGEEATEVAVVTGDATTRATPTDPNVFEARVKIPRAAIGPELIVAYATLANGAVALARVEVIVRVPQALRNIVLSVEDQLTFIGQVTAVSARGNYEDGMARDLTAADTGTSYATSDSTVFGVHPNGLIQARRTGRAILSVTNGTTTSTVEIDVRIPEGSTNTIPLVAAPPEQMVTGESLVTLSVNASDPDGDPLTYEWEQYEGRVVFLRTPQSEHPVFISPDVSTEQVLEFAVVVTDSKRAASFPVVVRVRVQPKAP